MGEKLPHLFIADRTSSHPYTYPGGGGGSNTKLPARNQVAHAKLLSHQLKQLDLAHQQTQRERDSWQIFADANPINFKIDANRGFKPESLEDARAGISLSLIQLDGHGAGHAIVRVPIEKVKTITRKLDQYGDPNQQTLKGRPKHEALVACISSIQTPTLADFWTGPPDALPTGDQAFYWEVWISKEIGATRFRNQAQRLNLPVLQQTLVFPEREVVLTHATVQAMEKLIRLGDSVAELRPPSLVRDFLSMSVKEQREWGAELAERLECHEQRARVCLLDTGLDQHHPILSPALDPEGVLAYNDSWGTEDHHGHGTLMGGLIVYGDLLAQHLASRLAVPVSVALESVKVLPPPPALNVPALYGEISKACVALAESTSPGPRSFCLAVTAQPCPTGEPTSWSAAIDQICSGAEEVQISRLVFVSAGNANWGHENFTYPEWNHQLCPIEKPAQAWNAVTVGAFTEFHGHVSSYPNHQAAAAAGELSPFSCTGVPSSEEKWPHQPDVVFEGGNLLISPEGNKIVPDEFVHLSTRRQTGPSGFTPLFAPMYETSASTALAGHFAAQLQAEYPHVLPETLRGLMIHAGRWTPGMKNSFPDYSGKARVKRWLACYGMGVPDLERARYSQRNLLTLVVEREIQPFSDDGRTHELHLHKLPWPTEVLEQLEETNVELRVTLSYFVEPNPGSRGWKGRYQYGSHGLRFELCTASEAEEQFLKRINKRARSEGEKAETSSDAGQWTIGPDTRHRGSIHSDIWRGTARDLAAKNLVAIYPAKGWWSERKGPELREPQARYSLIVSLETPEVVNQMEVDIYSAVAEVVAPVETEWGEE